MTFVRPAHFSLRSSIRTQLLILVLVVIAFSLVATAASLQRQEGFYRRAALEQTLAASRVVSSRVDDHFSNMDALLRTVAVAVGPQLGAIEANDARLRQIQRGLPPYFSSISVLALDGRMLSSSTATVGERALLNFADRKYFIDAVAKHDFAIGDPILSRTSGEWIVIAARPILASDRQVLAVVSMSTRLARFQELLIPQGLPPASVMTVLNEKGIVVARSINAQQWIGRDLSASTNFQRALREREFASDVVASDGVQRLSGYSTAQLAPWVAYVGIARDVALAPARLELRDQLLISAAALVLALTLVVWLIRGIAAPVRQIADTAARVAAGDEAARATSGGPREIAAVAAQFNAMLDARQSALLELRESERRYRDLMDSVELLSVMLDRDGHVLYCNDFLCQLTGWSRQQILGQDWFSMFVPVELGDVKTVFLRMLADDSVARHFENELLTHSGARRTIQWSNSVLRSAGGEIVGTASIGEDVTERKLAQALLGTEKVVLELLTTGAPLTALLEAIARNVQATARDALCSILLLDADCVHLRHGAAPSLPEEYNHAIDGQAIGPKAGSCGTAAFRNEQVIVTDIATDPLWADYAALALQHGLCACWSRPVRAADGKVLGTFAVYYRSPHAPGATDLELVARWTHLTAVAIERALSQQERSAQLDELRRWYRTTLGREQRLGQLKSEVNELRARLAEPARYASQ